MINVFHYLHPELVTWLPKLQDVIDQVSLQGLDRVNDIWQQEGMYDFPMATWAPGVYSFPFLNEDSCTYFANLAYYASEDFKVNEVEGQPYQIPELVLLDKAPEAHWFARQLWLEALKPMCVLGWGKSPDHCTAIQIAKYTPDNTAGGNWHHDESSEFTILVNIAPHLYTGGGTAIKAWGPVAGPIVVDPLPLGHALMFNGRMSFHKGEKVETGERNLLV